MQRINAPFDGDDLPGQQDFPFDALHGMFFDVMRTSDPDVAQRLHDARSPRPFALAPRFRDGLFSGVSISSFVEVDDRILAAAWRAAANRSLPFGNLALTLQGVDCCALAPFAELLRAEPIGRMTLRFRSPTAYAAPNGYSVLPMPSAIFRRPYDIWQRYAAPVLALPDDWLDWCRQSVVVRRHAIRTHRVRIGRDIILHGFTGRVQLALQSGQIDPLYARIWHALGRLSTVSGSGINTTVGMGAVEHV